MRLNKEYGYRSRSVLDTTTESNERRGELTDQTVHEAVFLGLQRFTSFQLLCFLDGLLYQVFISLDESGEGGRGGRER
jgi:hypothetical protein